MTVLDSSAIYKIISINRLSLLSDQYTSSLAFFELGNIIWKSSILAHIYSQKEALELLSACEMALDKMRVGYSDFDKIYKIAAHHHISFYDASYVCLALDFKSSLITLDDKLAQKVSSIVDILSFEQFIK
jgi:predicted nucleic acid-binding protein